MVSGNRTGKPNIVWLIQDHVTWKHYCETEGPKPHLATYERLAAEGTSFQRAYTVTPLCTPARSSMVTGVYAHKHGITRNDPKSLRQNFAEDMPLFHTYLQSQGYRAAYFGKWHAGEGVPADFGFEGFSIPGYGNPYRSKAYAEYLQRYDLPDPIVDLEWAAGGPAIKQINMRNVQRFAGIDPSGLRSSSSGLMRTPAESSESYFVAQLACEWLESLAGEAGGSAEGAGANEADTPFLLRVDVWGPHQPYLVAEPFADKIDPKAIPEYPNFSNTFANRPEYHKLDREEWRDRTGLTRWEEWQPVVARAYEHFSQTDSAMMKILDVLDRTGLADNTIVIYTADHGDILGSGGGLFDKDSMLTEETMRIPLVVRWPGVAEAGKVSGALASNMDIVPTVLEMGGSAVPEYMDGQSLVPLLKGGNAADWRQELMAEHYGHKNYDSIQRVLYYGSYKYVAHLDDSDELYDLSRDAFEWNNLIDEPSMSGVLADLRSRLAVRMKRYGDLADDSRRLIEQKRMQSTQEEL
ncbi:MAG: hypothetical protein K0R75_1905 [Paenibacillaceae bacterium]|nr:hypothetical protein [Paenibacillaceae bacterium]